ncbi:alpha/beta fold hydrolase [Streptomyces achromogenes]|uniref:alpha/beta fold hydrolase n=1 Tax=Streptomyces achromogenes TaxID=67255 RepID=UPI003700718F
MLMTTENGIRLSCHDHGDGAPVPMLTGSGHRAPGPVRAPHQVPAPWAAGFRATTLNNHGIWPSDDGADGLTVDDLVADVAAPTGRLGVAPSRAVGTAMGARTARKSAPACPGPLDADALMAACGGSGLVRRMLAAGKAERTGRGIGLPPDHLATVRAVPGPGPATLAGDDLASDWLDPFAAVERRGPGVRAQPELSASPDRHEAHRAVTVPCHVVPLERDRVAPPATGREPAAAILGAAHRTPPDGCGHRPSSTRRP